MLQSSLFASLRASLFASLGAILFASLLALLLAPTPSRADPACLPGQLFPEGEGLGMPARLDLGLVAGVPTLCARNDAEHAGLLGCWTVDATGGALSVSTATSLPGHSQLGKTDANGCIEGYCTTPKANADELLIWATSTNGTHAVILRERTLFVFDAKTKQQTTVIPISDDKAPENTNIGNEPIEILYVGNALYVVGTDAGPYIAVWSYKDDGTRTGVITPGAEPSNFGGYSVFSGGVNVLDDSHVALANAGLQTMLIIRAADGAREELVRPVSTAPCTKDEVDYGLDLGDYEVREGDAPIGVSAACNKTIVKNFEPYSELDPIRLPSGDFLAALSGKGLGSLAILDGRSLMEKQRLKLSRCAK